MTNDFTQTFSYPPRKGLRNKALALSSGFLFRFVMHIFHLAKNHLQRRDIFYKMHLKYIIKVTSEGRAHARRSNHRYRKSHYSPAGGNRP
ncbi:hypothetical protein EKN49_15630 [Enterobacter roggenkampii]|nr:hypothetical protein EKN49_15630 [Enterobacter roggenkampii]